MNQPCQCAATAATGSVWLGAGSPHIGSAPERHERQGHIR